MAEENWTVTSPQSMDIGGVTSLKLGMVRGRFDVVAHGEPVVRLELAEVHGDPVAVSLTAAGWRSGISCTAPRAGSRT